MTTTAGLSELEALLDALPVGFLVVAEDDRLERANQQLADWLRVPASSLVGLTLDRFVDQHVTPKLASSDSRAEIASFLTGDTTGPIELPLAGEPPRWLAWERSAIGVRAAWRHVFSDVSPGRQVLEIARDFASTISHDLRLPITIILGYAQGLRRRLAERDDEERNLRDLDSIIGGARRLNLMVTEAVDGLRLDTGLAQVAQGGLDLGQLARLALSRVERIYPDGNVEVRIEPVSVTVGDQMRLEQSIQTLIVNAIRHGEPPRILAVQERGPDVVIEVHDHGPGMSAEEVASLLATGRRTKGASAKSEALGMGVRNASLIAASLGGRLEIESTPGQGTIARLVVPIVAPDD